MNLLHILKKMIEDHKIKYIIKVKNKRHFKNDVN